MGFPLPIDILMHFLQCSAGLYMWDVFRAFQGLSWLFLGEVRNNSTGLAAHLSNSQCQSHAQPTGLIYAGPGTKGNNQVRYRHPTSPRLSFAPLSLVYLQNVDHPLYSPPSPQNHRPLSVFISPRVRALLILPLCPQARVTVSHSLFLLSLHTP